MSQIKPAETGLTYVELLVFIGMGSVMVATLGVIVSGAFRTSRQQMEQGAITEKARVQLERMSDEIRNAQYVDCNLDTDTADAGEHWLYKADEFEIVVLSNVDDDVEAERVRYFVETGVAGEERKLKRGVTQLPDPLPPGSSLCDWSEPESVQTVMDGLRNTDPDPDISLFQYFTSGDDFTVLTPPVVRLSSVLRIRLDLHIEEADSVNPGEVEVTTDVVPRGVRDPGACVEPSLKTDRYDNYSTVDFADLTFADCKAYCLGSAALGPSQCCPWSAAFYWGGNPNKGGVFGACVCEDTYLPPDITPDPVNLGEYTDYARECMGGTRCSGVPGNPICEAGCVDGPGQCVCVCPNGFAATTACSDGFDNDADGTADFAGVAPTHPPDPGCASDSDSSEWGSAQCDDGIDNDGCDGTDYKLNGSGDIDCSDPTDNDESPCTSPSSLPSSPPSSPPSPPFPNPSP